MIEKSFFIKAFPNEAVGYLKDGKFYELENLSSNPRHSFEVRPDFLLNEPDVLVHSHCVTTRSMFDPRSPSYEDLKTQIAIDIECAVCVTDGVECSDPMYWGNPKNRPALVGRDFIHNIQDCFSLVQDYYFQELGIELRSVPRYAGWAQDGLTLIESSYIDMGFKEIPISEAKANDLFFYQVHAKTPNHLGVYVGDQRVLTHWYGRASGFEPYSKWASKIVKAVRYMP